MNSRQSAAYELSNEQIQVLITGKFGDGCLHVNNIRKDLSLNFSYSTNGIHKEYIEYKKMLLGNLVTAKIQTVLNRGYKQNLIHRLSTIACKAITDIATESLEESLYRMDELGLALWFMDDGSLHKTKNFYNLNTQKYSKKINETLFVPFLKDKFGITATPTIERKKDGREFWYLRIKKFDGAFIVSEIIRKYAPQCFYYKLISSETIQKWSKLQEELKSADIDIESMNKRHLSNMLEKISI